MSIARILSRTALLAGVAAMSVVTLGSAAQAYDRGHRDHGWRDRGYHGRHYAPPARYHHHEDRSRRRDKNVGGAIALGVGALILGTIIAAEANRRHDRGYDDLD